MALNIGDSAIDFSLPAADRRTLGFGEVAGVSATVVLFWCNHCPYVQGSIARAIRMQDELAGLGVNFAAINANRADSHPEDSLEAMQRKFAELGYNFPYLRDESQDVARAYGAQRTPEAFLFDASRKLRYHGRIDDNPQDELAARSHDLRSAIDAVLAGTAPDPAETGAIGCTIKWK